MKRSLAIAGFLLIFSPGYLSACLRGTNEIAPSPTPATEKSYRWSKVIDPGKGCFEENCTPGKWAMAIPLLVAFDNKLFVAGRGSVWSSADGLNWQSEPKTDWGQRHGMAYVFFDNKLWITGGMRSWADFRNDVWHSSDGKTWKEAVKNAPWSKRRDHSLVVFNNKMWLLGGVESSGSVSQLPSKLLNDVWSSKDGINWVKETAQAAWPGGGHIGLVFKNKLWVIDTGRRTAWSSTDGRKWVQETAQAQWSERIGSGGLVFDDRIWIFGGRGLNDVWNSPDGKRWEKAFDAAPWSTRSANYSVVFDNKLWLYSGKTGREDSWSGDVWTMTAEK